MSKIATTRSASTSGNGLKVISILLLVIGGVFLLASLAFPEGEKEEQAFMVSAQQRQNMMDHGESAPKNVYQQAQEERCHQDFDDVLFLRAEHMLAVGIVLDVSGTVLLIFYILRRQKPKQDKESS